MVHHRSSSIASESEWSFFLVLVGNGHLCSQHELSATEAAGVRRFPPHPCLKRRPIHVLHKEVSTAECF